MFFETEAKAKNFIKFNGSDVEHKGELRTYYCPACAGYHITSKEHKRNYDSQTDRLIEAYKKQIKVPMIQELNLINELYEHIVSFNVMTRKAINARLQTDEFSKYSEKIKQEAKRRFYAKHNL
jgi:hypothetical protein